MSKNPKNEYEHKEAKELAVAVQNLCEHERIETVFIALTKVMAIRGYELSLTPEQMSKWYLGAAQAYGDIFKRSFNTGKP